MCNELWMGMEPQPLHNGMIQSQSPDVTQDFDPDVKIEVNLECIDDGAVQPSTALKWFKPLIYAQH
jgi:hypothetical protein